MDKRFFLALILTAVVVIATPLILGTRSTPAKSDAPDSSALLRDSLSSRTTPSVAEDTARRDSIATQPRVDSLVTAASVAPETTTVSTALADYRFSNIGAMPLTVELKSYKALDGSTQNVRLGT